MVISTLLSLYMYVVLYYMSTVVCMSWINDFMNSNRNPIGDEPCSLSDAINTYTVFDQIDRNTPFFSYRLIAEKMILKSISSSIITDFFSSSSPKPLLRRLIKRQCCANKKAFEFNDRTAETTPILDELHRCLEALSSAVSETVEVEEMLEYCSCFLNKYICFDSSMVEALKLICAWCLEPAHASPAVVTFLVSLLSTYPLNEEQSILFEGGIWPYLSSQYTLLKANPFLSICIVIR